LVTLDHTHSKVKLFTIGDETKEFKSGDIEEISIFEVGGVRFGAFICFELRFIDIWDRLRGVDIIMIPAMWGKPRKQHFEALTNSLAIINQCYVVASDSANDDMASSSSITSPFGDSNIDDSLEIIQMDFDNKEIKKMRRYLDVGLI
jgi:predicted amidohydrolase